MIKPQHASGSHTGWRTRRSRVIRRAVFGALLLIGFLDGQAAANDGNFELAGWQRRFKGVEDGAPAAVRAVVQTPDGFIWVGASNGLYRYDGVRFERVVSAETKPLQSDSVSALVVGPHGELWAGHDWGGLSVVRDGRHRAVKQAYISTVSYLLGTRTTGVWSVSIGGPGFVAARLVDQRWIPWIIRKPVGNITQAAAGADGNLWIIIDRQLFMISAKQATMQRIPIPPLRDATLAVDGNNRTVLITAHTIQRLSGGGPSTPPGLIGSPVLKPSVRSGGTVVFDGTDNFWAVEDDGALRRYGIDAGSRQAKAQGSWKSSYRLPPAELTQHDLAMVVDREHNLWLGTSLGLERFSPAAFSTVLKPATGEGVAPTLPYAVRDGKGTVWIRRLQDLFKVADDGNLERQPVVLPSDFTPCTSPKGGLWLPDGKGRLQLYGGGTSRSVSLKGTKWLGTLSFGHCIEDGSGRVWANEATGLERLDTDQARMVGVGAADAGYAVINLIADQSGGVLAYVGRGSLWRSNGVQTRYVWQQSALTLGLIEVMYQGPGYLLLGGDRGLARYDGRLFSTLTRDRLPYLASTTGIVQTSAGETWLQSDKGVVRIRTDELERAFRDPKFIPNPQIYDMANGLPGPVPSLNMSSVTADRQGRIWITTTNGIARYDPKNANSNPLAPLVAITGVEAGTVRWPASPHITLTKGSSRIRISFAGLSFVNPEKLQFRYRLVGVDRTWVDAREDRAAVYTSLEPGTYKFQVIAANNDGVWNMQGASIEIDLPPNFYQRWWFAVLCLLLLLLVAWVAYRWRIQQVAQRLRGQAAERANERERIARDIHDTLLQSIQGLVLRFQSVASRMDVKDPNRSLLEHTLDRADGLIAEGKERVFGLRSEDQPVDLPAALDQLLKEAAFQASVERVFTMRGISRQAKAAVAREAREIVGEALFNAARHSGGKSVSLDLAFGAKALEISVVDDGIGIHPDRANERSTSGFGLIGMRERAKEIGGVLTVAPGQTGGTIVRLSVPRRRAYASRSP